MAKKKEEEIPCNISLLTELLREAIEDLTVDGFNGYNNAQEMINILSICKTGARTARGQIEELEEKNETLKKQIENNDRARNWELVEFLKKEVHYLLEIRGLQKELLNK